MKNVLKFIKTTAIGGLLVIVPATIILIVLAQIFYGLYSVAADIVGEIPVDLRNEAVLIVIITVASIIGLCFLTGLLIQTSLGVALQRWFSRNVARRIPMYKAIANLMKRFVGVEGFEFAPVEVDLYNSESRVLGLLIEQLPEDRCLVYIPSSPVATIGNVFIVPIDSVQKLDASTAETISVMTQWGVDANTLYAGKQSGTGREADNPQI